MGVRRFATVVAAAAAAAPGVYLLIYLFRWEWHRAILAGILFVAAEVALAAGMLLRRLSGLAARLDRIESGGGTSPGASPAVLSHVRAAAPPPADRFAWLQPDRTNVFLPVLLGAGVVASALAWVVEGVSRVTARPALEHRLALRLAALAPPAGGLLGPAPAHPLGIARRPRVIALVAIPLVAPFAAAGIDALADASQTRPDHHRTEVGTAIDLQLIGDRAASDPHTGVSHLWGICASIVAHAPAPRIYRVEGEIIRLELATDVGPHARRRLHGCLEDASLDGVQARVVAMRTVSRDPVPSGPSMSGS